MDGYTTEWLLGAGRMSGYEQAYAPRDVWLHMCIPNSECYPTQHVIHSARRALPTTYADPHNTQAGRQPNPQSDGHASRIPRTALCASVTYPEPGVLSQTPARFAEHNRVGICAPPYCAALLCGCVDGRNGACTTVTARWDIDLTQQHIGCWRCTYRGFFRRKLRGPGTAFSLKHLICFWGLNSQECFLAPGNPNRVHQLARLRRDESTTGPPKRPADFQWYMRHADYKEGMNERFLEEHGDALKERHIALRCEVARELLKEESEEVQLKIKAECDAAHAEELEAYKESGAGLPNANTEVQCQCRENFLGIVQPLLAGLHEYMGLTHNIIGACINEDTQEFETMSANAGVVGGKDWNLMDAGPSAVPPNPSGKPSMAAPPSNAPAPAAAPPNAAATQPSDLLESNGLLRFDPDRDINMGPPPPPPIIEDGDDEALEKGVLLPVVTPTPSAPVVTPAPSTLVVTPAPSAPVVTPRTVCTLTPAPSVPVVTPVPSVPVVTPVPSAPVGPAPTWGLKILCDDLRAEILAKSGDERDNLLWDLQQMNDYMLERENNMARNRRLLRELDLNRVMNLLGMKCPKQGGKSKLRKKAKKGEEEEWSNDSDSAADEDEDNSGNEEGKQEDGPARVRMPPTTRGRAARGGRTAKGGAKWAETARSMLLEVEMGDDWKEVVRLWWTLEEQWKFASSNTSRRPNLMSCAWSSALSSAFFRSFSAAFSASSLATRSLLLALRAARSRLCWVIVSRAATFASWCSCLIVIWIKLLSSTGGTTGPSDESSAKAVHECDLAEREDGLATRDIDLPVLPALISERVGPASSCGWSPAVVLLAPPVSAVSSARALSHAVQALADSAGRSPSQVASPRNTTSLPAITRRNESRLGDGERRPETRVDALRHLPGPILPLLAQRRVPSPAAGVSCSAALLVRYVIRVRRDLATKEVHSIDKMRGLNIAPLKALAKLCNLVAVRCRFHHVGLRDPQVFVRLAFELDEIAQIAQILGILVRLLHHFT
ncbi:hypothetical protein DFH08DRAFT_819535 [Mycena albidolilacea]|uniref:Uncharacterized protein n=1 Tax=Mycena albidolilacea TaxID=1033008 RepID=A0AAD6ZEK0_9AGAR|nr:hypothetical protein DFH08DRAFT_819535 [Mycena albidolilacea]